MSNKTILAIACGVLAGMIVEIASRALGCTVTIGGDLLACAFTAATIARRDTSVAGA